jgi:hypothetical protein
MKIKNKKRKREKLCFDELTMKKMRMKRKKKKWGVSYGIYIGGHGWPSSY